MGGMPLLSRGQLFGVAEMNELERRFRWLFDPNECGLENFLKFGLKREISWVYKGSCLSELMSGYDNADPHVNYPCVCFWIPNRNVDSGRSVLDECQGRIANDSS
jgi:hypothetical protein